MHASLHLCIALYGREAAKAQRSTNFSLLFSLLNIVGQHTLSSTHRDPVCGALSCALALLCEVLPQSTHL